MDTGICTTCGAVDIPVDQDTEQCDDCAKDEGKEPSEKEEEEVIPALAEDEEEQEEEEA